MSNRFKALFIAPDFTRQSNFDVPDRLKPGLQRRAPDVRVGVPALAGPLVLDHFVSDRLKPGRQRGATEVRVGVPALAGPLVMDHFVSDRLKPGLQRACELAGSVGIAIFGPHLINMFRTELPRDDS